MATDETPHFGSGVTVRTKGLVNFAQHNGMMAVVIALADPQRFLNLPA